MADTSFFAHEKSWTLMVRGDTIYDEGVIGFEGFDHKLLRMPSGLLLV